ncbi:MAG: fructokinase [Hyphomicrobiaceae bacterium]|jgi:fructokinase
MSAMLPPLRIGIDLGGTKIEGLALDASNGIAAGPIRTETPQDNYNETLAAIAAVIADLEATAGAVAPNASIGIGMPGSISKSTGLVQNANSTWLNGQPLQRDLEAKLQRPVRLANDANCFALSEATDGSGADARSVLGVILGTGCGGGLVIDKQLIDGPMGIGGEWGHNPLPWAQSSETPGPACWCGRHGCMETWVSGPALETQYLAAAGQSRSVSEIAAISGPHDAAADVLARHTDRLGRGLAHVLNIFDPDVIVLGGGLSNLLHLYRDLPGAIVPHLFTDAPIVDIRRPKWGDSSGVRGAAWLWDR